MISTEFKFVFVIALAGAGYWVSTLPEHYRQQGRIEEQDKVKAASKTAVERRDREFEDVKTELAKERESHAQAKIDHDKKFNDYVADVRAGRVPGLRINRSSLCTAQGEKASSTSGAVEETTVRLPRAIEKSLFRFADDRDQIILDFESFKQEVRLAKCFAD